MKKIFIPLIFSFIILFTQCNNPTATTDKQQSTDSAGNSSKANNPVKDFGIEMVHVPGGSFMMGSKDGPAQEKPVHKVTLNGYYIGKTEVTQKLWHDVMGDAPGEHKGCDSCPVENVSWADAQNFLEKLNALSGKKYRLPTEAEWEFAARGGNDSKGTVYSGGDEKQIASVACYIDNSKNTQPVGKLKGNELGIFDMSGNVLEWCNDWYDAKYYASGPENNPQGPPSGTERVNRGGSFRSTAPRTHISFRFSDLPEVRSAGIGFRLAASE